jgi:hypothetical protein
MDKEQRLKNRVENLEMSRLKGVVKTVNETKLADKIRLVGIKKFDMANAFTLAVEKIAAEDESKIADPVSAVYNELHTDEESPLDKAVEKKTTAKKAAAKSAPKKEGPPKQPVDEYGTRKGTLAHTFVQEVKKKPQTMDDVRKADWNPRGYHFNDTVRRLEASKQATVGEDNIITIK